MDKPKAEDSWLEYLIFNAKAVFASSLMGVPKATERFKYLRDVKPGDLVMEISTYGKPFMDPFRIGYLVFHGTEFVHSEEEWETVKEEWEGESRPMEEVFRIKLLTDGTEHRWRDAEFIKVLTGRWELP